MAPSSGRAPAVVSFEFLVAGFGLGRWIISRIGANYFEGKSGFEGVF
jgi:hypothetical protein